MFTPKEWTIFTLIATGQAALLAASVYAQEAGVPALPEQRIYPASTVPLDELMGPRMDESDTMVNEPVLFVRQEEGAEAKGALLFAPKEIISVRDSKLQVTYESGKDYLWNPGTETLTLPEGSRIPSRVRKDFYRAPDSADAIAEAVGAHEGEWLLYGESSATYADLQVLVTYRHAKESKELAAMGTGSPLKGAIARLKSDKPFKVALLGDSISEGCNASAFMNTAPYMPPYGLLVAEGLRKAYGRDVEFVNLSKGGMTSAYGVEMIPTVLQEQPDLLIVAFGMNDASLRVSAAQYGDAIGEIIRETRAKVPHAEIVVVATMLANPEWSGSNPGAYEDYLAQIDSLKKGHVAVADMTQLWKSLLRKKTYWDLTANGVNHPNDFGHRLYAQTILTSLLPKNP